MPKVSVIMPVRNAAGSVTEAVRSVLTQDFADLELLVGDDASTDSSRLILEALATDNRVRIIQSDTQLGRAGMRNRLLQLATGDYISWCDADDLMLPGNLRKCSHTLDENAQCGLVYSDVLIVREDSQRRVILIQAYGRDTGYLFDLVTPLCVLHQGSMVRRTIITSVGFYDEASDPSEDHDMWFRLQEVTAFHRLKGEVLHCYRDRFRAEAERALYTDSHKDAKRKAIIRRYGECPLTAIDW